MAWSIIKGTLSWVYSSRSLPGNYCVNNCPLQGNAIPWSAGFLQHLFTTAINLCFAVIFLLVLIISRRYLSRYSYMHAHRPAVNGVASFLSSIVGLTNFGLALHIMFESLNNKRQESVLYCLQGLTWVVLAISLKLSLTKPPAIVAITWWTIEFVVGTLLASSSIAKISTTQTFSADTILNITTWLNCFLLLYCAIKAIKFLPFINTKDLSDPLFKEVAAEETKVTQLSKAGIFNRLIFKWLDPLLRLGYSTTLEHKDIPHLPSEDEAFTAQRAFAEAWELQKSQYPLRKQTILKALSKCYWKDIVVTGVFAFMRSSATISGPLFLRSFVQFAGGKQSSKCEKFVLVGGLFAVKLIESLSQRHWYFNSRRAGFRMRSALMAAVYQKQLRLSSLGRRRHATGEIVNYMAVDAYRFGEFPWWLHWGWIVPFQMSVAIGILFATVGWATIPGLLIIIITVILNNPLAKSLQKCQAEFMAAQDERLRVTSEILNSMKIIKLQAWEEKFEELVENLRAVEFKWLSSVQINRTYGTILYWMSPIIVASIVFAACAVIGDPPLTATTIFTVLATFRVMQEPVRMLSDVLAILIQVKVSLDRLDKFLQDDELGADAVVRKSLAGSEYSIKIHQGILSWDPESSLPTLKGVNLQIKKGEKVAICGSVGCGKSALLYTILGEIPKLSGDVQVYGSIAYVAQTAWIQSGTVRDNILYGKPMDKIRYKKAIKACALEMDIESFAHGDMTEIGERGLNMSGGQKQRIQLARAVYNDADIYLLDDPFSAVDAHTASTLFNDCVMGALAMKTVVLVTHQVEFLPAVNKILVMEGGEIKQAGSYEQILATGQTFEQLVNVHKEAMNSADPVNYPVSVGSQGIEFLEINPLELSRMQSASALVSEESVADISFNIGQLIAEEEKETGVVGLQQYFDYIRVAGGALLFLCIVLSQGAFVVGQVASNYWLASAILNPNIDNGLLVGVYASISICSGAFVYGRARLVVLLGLRASKAFFSGMINSIFRAPMAFLDTTPVGRILIRASSDMSLLDLDIAWAYTFVLSTCSDLIGMIFIISLVTWQVLVVVIPVLFITRWIQMYYLASARELTRINGTTKAPVMNNAAETALGVVTIRAFNTVERFKEKNLYLIDTDASLFFHTNAAMEWLILRLESLGNIVLFSSALLLVSLPASSITPGFAGLALSYALSLSSCQVFMVQWQCNLANFIVSVERIKQYMNLPCEPLGIIESSRPPLSWPSEGRIQFENLKIRYRPNAPLILKGINCTFDGGKRVGVVGRTSSGKTTLISALFRLIEPAGGRILIDGLDICNIGLRDMRSKLSIIPQEPTLFKGTIRSNLDPLGLYSDHEIWEALQRCQMGKFFGNLLNQLDSSVATMDPNADILIELARLRGISAFFRDGDESRRFLSRTMDAIVDTIARSTNVLYDITSYREQKRREYEDGLDYNAVKKLKITKEALFGLFRDPRTGEIPNSTKAHISIEWCIYQPILDNWMSRWYMVFDAPPHNNREIPLYFLRKLYAEFVLQKHVNYFSVLEFQGVGGGMPQNRPNARVQDPNRPIPAPRAPLHGPDVPTATHIVSETRDAFLSLARQVLRHSTALQRMGGDAGSSGHDAGPSSSSRPSSSAGPSTGPTPSTRAGPSTSAPPSAPPQPSCDPHECTSCGRPCYGTSADTVFTSFLDQFFDAMGKGPASVAGTDPPVGGGIQGHTGPSSETGIPRSDGKDPSEFVATDPSVFPEIPDPSLGGEIPSTLDDTETPQKTTLTQEQMASMVDAAVDAASAIGTSHTEAPAAGVVRAPPGPNIIDVQPTAPSPTQSQLGPSVVESPTPLRTRRRLDLTSPRPPPRPHVWHPSLYTDPRDSSGKGKGKGKRKHDD